MKVYAEKTRDFFGKAFTRIADARKRYAPNNIELTNNLEEADLQIIDVIGKGEEQLIKAPRYILNIYCWYTSERYSKEFLEGAELVTSTYDIPSFDSTIKFKNFMMLPVGYDPKVFYQIPNLKKKYGIMTTGYVAGTEAIDCCFEACKRMGFDMVHVGGNFKWGTHYINKENITDDEMRVLYNESRIVSALRFIEGFEVGGIEALACGVRPVVFNNPIYTTWYKNHAQYITECKDSNVLISEIMRVIYNPIPVDKSEQEWVKKNFCWEKVMGNFWKGVLG
jgi:hypothetical protein